MGNLIAASMFDGNLEAVDRQDSYSGYCPSTCSSGYISQYCACPASNQGLVIDRNLLLALVLGAAAAVFAIYQAFVVKAAAAGRDFPEIPGFFDTFRIGKLVKIFLIWNSTTFTAIDQHYRWFPQQRDIKLLYVPWDHKFPRPILTTKHHSLRSVCFVLFLGTLGKVKFP